MNTIAQLLQLCFGRPRLSRAPTALCVSPFVRVSVHDDGLALLHIQSGKVFLCNRIGSRIWQGLSVGCTPEDVADQISRQYGVGRDIAEKDTFSFVGELERRGLMTRTAGL